MTTDTNTTVTATTTAANWNNISFPVVFLHNPYCSYYYTNYYSLFYLQHQYRQ